MDQTALLQFLLDASRRGYAAGHSVVKPREADHSTTIVLEQGESLFRSSSRFHVHQTKQTSPSWR
jgi:hypothetical protein